MTQKFQDEDADILQFGGGINSRASEDQIDPLECTEGENFLLDPGNSEFRPRPPFQLLGQADNAKEIRGFATLKKTDGTVSMLVQAGNRVYEWDGTDFTSVGTVDPNARIRGKREAIWNLADKVIIADLELQEDLMEWDGTTLTTTTFLASNGSDAFGTFRAKYVLIDNERALYFNIHDNGGEFPHLMVSSERGNYLIVSTGDRPSSSIGADAPFFLPMPQLKAINGVAKGFGVIGVSQEDGDFEKLVGSTSQDFAWEKLHPDSAAVGDEAVASITNDIIFGAQGRIESLESTEKFGDVEFDDSSFKIRDDIKSYNNWTLVYNQRLKRLYCFPDGQPECWVMFTDFVGSQLSPWSKYTSDHPMNFKPTAVMSCYDPVDGLEYVFMGDSDGNLYRMEGAAFDGDGGTDSVVARRRSIMFSAPLDAEAFDVSGFIEHRYNEPATMQLTMLWSGYQVYSVGRDIPFAELVFETVFGGDAYFGGKFYFGLEKQNRLVRKKWGTSGKSNQFQIETKIVDTDDFEVTKVGFRYQFEE